MSDARGDIIQLINLYGVAVDSQQWNLFDRIFTDTVDADYGAPAHWRERATFKRDFAAFHAPFDSTQHTMLNHLVQIDGEVAHALTYGTWRLIRRAAGDNPLWDGSGWYDDELVLTSAGWRIRTRRCRVVWWSGNPQVNQTIPGVSFDTRLCALRDEHAAGRVGFLAALRD